MASGIYQIKNLINNKIYIGSACNLNTRRSQHFSELKKLKHPNSHLQSSFNKYQIDNFVFEVLFTCPKSELVRIEQYFINNYNPEYNILKMAGSSIGYKHTQESLDIISKKAKESSKKFSKPVYQIELSSANVINTFTSITEASRVMGLKVSFISECVSGKYRSAGGFGWCLVENYNKQELNIRYSTNQNFKPVNQYDLNMNLLNSFESVKAAGQFMNCHPSSITEAVKKNVIRKGCIWKLKENNNGTK